MFRRKRKLSDFNAEIEAHLRLEVERLQEQGLSANDARAAAHRAFGNVALVQERFYESGRWLPWDQFWQDIRYGLRLLRRSPGFTAVAVITLALGIGANTAVFSLIYGLAFRNLPVPHPQQLVRFGAHVGEDSFVALSLPMFEGLARSQKVFSSVFAWSGDGVYNIEVGGSISRADIWAVTGNFQSELGAIPEMGRLISDNDVDLRAPSATQVAVLDYNFWQRRYGGALDTLGKTIKIEGLPFTIIGVLRKGSSGINAEAPPEITVPLTAQPLLDSHLHIVSEANIQESLQRPDALWLEAAGRLRPGISLELARAQLDSLWPAIRDALAPASQSPAVRARFLSLHLKIESGAKGASFLRNRFTQPLYVLWGIAALVLLVACVNLASLMLARAASRGHELRVRIALGASRARLVGQMLTESVMLSLAGMLGGLAFAYWGSRALSRLIVREIYIVPAEVRVTPDLRIVAFAASAAILTGVLFGLVPAWRSTKEDPNSALQESSRALARKTGKLGGGLIVAQVALSLILLVGAGLFTRTLQKLRSVDPGFRTRGMLNARLSAKPGGYHHVDFAAYYRQLAERVSSLPRVSSAAIVHMQPGGTNSWTEEVRVKEANASPVRVDFDMMMPGAFRTMGISLLRGRDFTWQDDEHGPHVAIVSRSFAEQFFPDKDPIGQRIEITSHPKWQTVQVIGVAADASLYDIRRHAPPTIYTSLTQYGPDWSGWSEIIVQTEVPASAMRNAIQEAVESFGHDFVFRLETIPEGMERSILRERVIAILSDFFGALGLLLAAIGLYGLMAYNVTRRTREIGIRMALGAQRGTVQWMVLRETLILALLGMAIGVPSAIAASRFVASMLYGVTPSDSTVLASVSIVFLTVTLMAGFLPAYRATCVDPMVALRCE